MEQEEERKKSVRLHCLASLIISYDIFGIEWGVDPCVLNTSLYRRRVLVAKLGCSKANTEFGELFKMGYQQFFYNICR